LLGFEIDVGVRKLTPTYELDEPEAALSPTRQMAMLSRIHQLVEQESQFIIATHSPIILAYPQAGYMSLEMVNLKFVSTLKLSIFLLRKVFLIIMKR
jgi:predicted ATPase